MDGYEILFKETIWPSGPTAVKFERGLAPVESLISNVNAVPITEASEWVIIQLRDGKWEIPGGTVEPGERPLVALQRELIEEAGAQIISAAYIGAWRMHSYAEQPFRPHLPHPLAYRAVYLCKVKLVSQPQIPEEGGEQVIMVKRVSLEEAIEYFEKNERHEIAALYRFAATFAVV